MPRHWTLTMGIGAFQDLTCWVVASSQSRFFFVRFIPMFASKTTQLCRFFMAMCLGEDSNSVVSIPFVVPPLLFISTSNNWGWHGFTPWNMWCNHAHKSTRLSWFYPHVWHIPHLWVVPSPLQQRLFKHSLTALRVVLTCHKSPPKGH